MPFLKRPRTKFNFHFKPKMLVGCEVSSDVMLLDYLRNYLELRGTKYMCREAGCGACIVSAVKSPGGSTVSVNSCMVSITSCQDWDITTIEEVGNRRKGYHTLQNTLAKYNGTQCGHCSPGWIMAMYSLLKNKNELTMLELEKSFGGNICRCTGYRPILEAFKTYAKDSPIANKFPDIEDLDICKNAATNCSKSKFDETDWLFVSTDDVAEEKIIEIKLKDERHWFRVNEIRDIFQILKREGTDSYMLVNGNTAKGAYPIDDYPRILIDVSGMRDLKGYCFDQNLIVGAGTTITELLDIFKNVSQREYFHYLQKLYDHLKLVAHISVRNLGSIGGNLMIKHQHNEFPSDIFLLLETVGAHLTIQNVSGIGVTVTMQQFLRTNMRGHVILNALLPPLGSNYKLVTFKIMPRSQNAQAIVNAGFLYKLKANSEVEMSRIAFGGLSPSFTRASVTESYLIGKTLFTNDTLQAALQVLKSELVVTENPPKPSAAYRKQLALGLFYKGLLTLCPKSKLNTRFRSGAINIHEIRPVSEARQVFDTKQSLWPLNQPIQKVEALIQCAGEALYTEDLPIFPHEVSAAFAFTTVPTGNIISIDPRKALNSPGVLAFYTAKDIPGLNSFTPEDALFYTSNEEVLCSGKVKYYNQPFGIVVAESRHIAEVAAKLIEVKYDDVKKPILDIKKAREHPDRVKLYNSIAATDKGLDTAKVIKGANSISGQYHFTLETLACVVYWSEKDLKVYSTSHWLDGVQIMISRALNIDQNRIDVHVRRLGGSFGIKISRNTQVAVACSLVAYKLNRPCRFIQSLPTNIRAVGKRAPTYTEFEVGVDSAGAVQYMNLDLYKDEGHLINEQIIRPADYMYYNCYTRSRWNYRSYHSLTDTAKNTWCRSPGSFESISMIELTMEQIAYEMSLDPLEVRLANLDMEHFSAIKEMIDTIIIDGDYYKRRANVNTFNADNRWKKRGLRFSLMRWTPEVLGPYEANLAVYHGDGTVAIAHSGTEMGQGINTKAVQICAFILKIPIDKIIIKENNTVIAPNNFMTAASVTSQNVGIGVQKCCEELLRRLKPIRDQMDNPTWQELITKAFESSVDLQTHYSVTAKDYFVANIFGVTLAEVEIDVLTGESEVLRVDILVDAGQSVSPEIDIGQVEGAFIMGHGYWTYENLVYDASTGELLTDRAWDYHVPQARDIPQDFRIYFRKNSYSSNIILGSKTVNEPPICMSVVIALAIREAITSARLESGIPTTKWFSSVGPYTVEKNCLKSATKIKDFKFY